MNKQEQNLETIRHSTAHVMAAAVLKLFPKTKFAIGPSIENGFYYDFEFVEADKRGLQRGSTQITPEDLPEIEKEMKKIIEQDIKFEKEELSFDQAKKLFADQPYKLELIEDIKKYGSTEVEEPKTQNLKPKTSPKIEQSKKDKITIYKLGNFTDLCKGPHVNSTKDLKKIAFKLDKIAGAYWRGDEKNKMLTRIYGLAFENQKELDKYLELREEAEKRDHRKLGKELGLFIFDEEVGQGLPLWLPKGAILRQQMENFILTEYQKKGYQLVRTPHIALYKLFERSGHLSFYKESMYSPMDIDGEDYYVKPMNCPFHVKIYQHEPKSYRDLPIRYTELGTVYRYEKSGTLHGLTRVRGFTQDDAHIICTAEQLTDELVGVIDLTKYILNAFGFEKFKVVLSIRDLQNKDKYLGNDKEWNLAEAGLKKALEISNWKYEIEEGEAVFYGPKIDIKVLDAVGREWQISTLQLDFNLPEKFDMVYVDKNGNKKRPFMLHRALLGSLERFTGVLIEHYAGAFPVWLSPVQIKIINVGSDHEKHCLKLAQEFKQEGLRVELDLLNETVGNKIRKAIQEKVPYMLVIGDKEMKSKDLHVRVRGSEKVEKIKKDKFIKMIKKQIEEMK